jgi:hypothetical protein
MAVGAGRVALCGREGAGCDKRSKKVARLRVLSLKTCLYLPLVLALAGCGDPMQGVARLADQDMAEDAPTLDAVPKVAPPESERVGLFARLLGERAAPGGNAAEASFPAEEEGIAETAEGEVQAAAPKPDGKPAARQGLLASLFEGGRGKDEPPSVPDNQVALGTLLPYGVVKPICGLNKGQMGKVVAKYPDRRPTYKVYDSDPGNTGAHTFYVTGFEDGCARQFTASLAMFGSVAMHESLRYGLPAKVQPYSVTDKAYEKVKARVCGVPRKTPCGKRVDRLADDTVFLSIYERFGGNSQWENLLLHAGEVVAQDKKGG